MFIRKRLNTSYVQELLGATVKHEDRVRIAYTLLPPPLSALPAKYHAPISLLVHSLSTGWISAELADLVNSSDAELAFLLGLVHDIHQKLIEDGLSSPKTAKKYIEEKLDELGLGKDYFNYISEAIDEDACGKNNPIRGVSREIPLICHIGDMIQGKYEDIELLYWLRSKVKELDQNLTVRYYSVMIPQPFARSYIMQRIYQKYIRERSDCRHLALASPWGLYVITYENELPDVLDVSWDDIRAGCDKETGNLIIVDYKEVLSAEKEEKTKTLGVNMVKFELEEKMWSRFARMFYCKNLLEEDEPIYPTLDHSLEGLFVNIRFTDIEFKEIPQDRAYKCGLCGLPHFPEHSLSLTMYGTKKKGNVKIAGVYVVTEKWNRFLPPDLKVKSDDEQGLWWNRIGMCPLCALDALGVRYSGFIGELNGFISISFAKPIPITLLEIFARMLRDSDYIEAKDLGKLAPGSLDGIVFDYSSATIATARDIPEPRMENMFGKHGVFIRLGKLIEWGLYPVKYLSSLDTSVSDRLIVTTHNFPALDFSVTNKDAKRVLPWIGALVKISGDRPREEVLQALEFKPFNVPLCLLALDKEVYDFIQQVLSYVGMRV